MKYRLLFLLILVLPFTYSMNNEFDITSDNYQIVYGNSDSYDDFYSSLVLAGSLYNKNLDKLSSFPKVITSDDVLKNMSKIIVGGPCSNLLFETHFKGTNYSCDNWSLKKGESLVSIKSNDVYIAGHSASDTLRAVKFFVEKNNLLGNDSFIILKKESSVYEVFDSMINDHKKDDNLVIVYGDDGTDSDLKNALLFASYIENKTSNYPVIKNTNDKYNYNGKDLIIIGGPCANNQFRKFITNSKFSCDNWDLVNDESLFYSGLNNNRKVIAIAGTTLKDTKNAIEVLFNDSNNLKFHLNSHFIYNEKFNRSEIDCTGFFCNFNKLFVKENQLIFEDYNKMVDSKDSNCEDCFFKHQSKEYYLKVVNYFSSVVPENDFENAERRYILGSIINDKEVICSSVPFYKSYLSNLNNSEDILLLNEILLFLSDDCMSEKESYYYLGKVVDLLSYQNNIWKINLYEKMFRNDMVDIKVEPYEIKYKKFDIPKDVKSVILGNSSFVIDNKDIVISQVERVVRDWYSLNINTFPLDSKVTVPYIEGNILGKIVNYANFNFKPISGTVVVGRTLNGWTKWYSTDDKGKFRFEVLDDKINYPTTKCFKNVCLILDTHGISSLVDGSVKNNASVVIGCGDYYDKMDAAFYLAKRGINVLYPTDRFSSEMLGYDAPGISLGSAPVKYNNDSIIIGGQKIIFDVDEKIIVQTTTTGYPSQYYDAPHKYFDKLEEKSGIDFDIYLVDVNDVKVADKVIDKARLLDSNIVALRIAFWEEYKELKDWLLESSDHKAVLFHSGGYDPGIAILNEFPNQTTFGDPNPIFI